MTFELQELQKSIRVQSLEGFFGPLLDTGSLTPARGVLDAIIAHQVFDLQGEFDLLIQ